MVLNSTLFQKLLFNPLPVPTTSRSNPSHLGSGLKFEYDMDKAKDI